MYFFLQSLGAILYIYENKVEFYILAVKAGKRVADDASNLQANSPKKIKLDQHNTKAKSPEKKAKSVGKLETKEEKIELWIEKGKINSKTIESLHIKLVSMATTTPVPLRFAVGTGTMYRLSHIEITKIV